MTAGKGRSRVENDESQVDSSETQHEHHDGAREEHVSTGMDWRIVAIIVFAVGLLVAAYVNKKYYSKKKPTGTQTVSAKPNPTSKPPTLGSPVAQRPQLSMEARYMMALQQREVESLNMTFKAGARIYILSHPATPIRNPGNPEKVAGFSPGGLFDVSKCAQGLRPQMFHRRPAQGWRGPLFANAIPCLGVNDKLKMIISEAAEVDVSTIADNERVIGVVVGNSARAYPVSRLNYHEVVNDILGDTPIVVSWSALGDAALAMTRTPPENETEPMVFASSGLIFQSVNLLYDLRTQSLWWPTRSRCIAGEQLDARRKAIPTVMTTWQAWKTSHPDTTVLAGTTPAMNIDYSKDLAVPIGYATNNTVLYPIYGLNVTKTPMKLKARVFGVLGPNGKPAKAYQRRLLRELAEDKRAFKDTIGEVEVTVSYDDAADVLRVVDKDGKEMFVASMFWAAWRGAYAKTEVWQRERLFAEIEEERKAEALLLSQPPSDGAPAAIPDQAKP